MRAVTYGGAAVLVALLIAASGFAVSPGGGDQLSPVPFDRTLSTGMTGVDIQQAESAGYAVPKGEVFYAQYQYVVGYYGLDALVRGTTAGRQVEQFGEPLAMFVSDYAGTDPDLTETGYVELSNSAQRGWTRVGDAWFVVDTRARTPAGPTPVPFGERTAARSFADEYGGQVVDWQTLQERLGKRQDSIAAQLTPPMAQYRQWANETVAETRPLRDRPVSIVVGEDARTLRAALTQAPANTTIRLPPGRYEGNLTIRKPITLRGAGNETVIEGNNGTALTATSPRVGVTSLRIEGVGSANTGDMRQDNGSAWDRRIRLIYGYGDAAVRLMDARGSLVENVTIATPANGIVALNSSGTVVRNVAIDGTEQWQNGFMGVLAMYSRLVVEHSTFEGGRDAVYTHYADGTVIRNNRMHDLRYGYHEMYSSNTVALDNTVWNTNAGIILMTRPTGTIIAGNDVRDSALGISTVGTNSYVTNNVVVNTKYGISIGTTRSVYRYNTVVRNEVGMRSSTLVPTNVVLQNDIVANDRPASINIGTVTVWGANGQGNYWGEIPGVDRDGDGTIDRTYRPTNAVDRTARHSLGSYTLARAPALGAVRQFQRAVPGLRKATVVDPAPLAQPVRPERLAALNVTRDES